MNSANYVDALISELKQSGKSLSEVSFEVAKACVGWAYVFGARGQYCTPSYRRSAYKSHSDHETIKTACKNFDGNGSCSGCKWYPNGKRTRVYDCRGFTYWVIQQVFGFSLSGGGATSQWNTASNWKQKGNVSDGIPADTIICLFYEKEDNPAKMAHTGLCFNNQTVECSAGVQYNSKVNKKWTRWAVPACVSGDIPTPVPPTPTKPTLRKGSNGSYVTLCQTMLIQRGYSCGSKGADGKFGDATLKAVKAFQADNGLKVDGIVGQATWSALESSEPTVFYTITIPNLTLSVAQGLVAQYPNATMTEERE